MNKQKITGRTLIAFALSVVCAATPAWAQLRENHEGTLPPSGSGEPSRGGYSPDAAAMSPFSSGGIYERGSVGAMEGPKAPLRVLPYGAAPPWLVEPAKEPSLLRQVERAGNDAAQSVAVDAHASRAQQEVQDAAVRHGANEAAADARIAISPAPPTMHIVAIQTLRRKHENGSSHTAGHPLRK